MNAPAQCHDIGPSEPGDVWLVYQCTNPYCRAYHARRRGGGGDTVLAAYTLRRLRALGPPDKRVLPLNLEYLIEIWVTK